MENIEIFGYSIPVILVIYFVFRAISTYEDEKTQEKMSKMSPKEREEFLKLLNEKRMTKGEKLFIGILIAGMLAPPLIVWLFWLFF